MHTHAILQLLDTIWIIHLAVKSNDNDDDDECVTTYYI